MTRIDILALGLLANVVACNTNDPAVANPQPIPVPDSDLIFVSSQTMAGKTLAAGAPAAAEPGVEIVIENVARGLQGAGQAATDGSFVVELEWRAGEQLLCWARRADGGQSGKVNLLLPSTDPSPPPPGIPLAVDSVSAVTAGKATVSGTLSTPSTVIVANRRAGAVATAVVAQPGDFSVQISATSGDPLVVFAVDTDSREERGLVETTVP